jgi:hypothetical protein
VFAAQTDAAKAKVLDPLRQMRVAAQFRVDHVETEERA